MARALCFDLDGTRDFDQIRDGGLFEVGEGPHLLTAYIGDELTGAKIAGTDDTSVAFSISNNGVYPLADIVERCLEVTPADRYQTAGELHAALEVAHAVYCG